MKRVQFNVCSLKPRIIGSWAGVNLELSTGWGRESFVSMYFSVSIESFVVVSVCVYMSSKNRKIQVIAFEVLKTESFV